MPVGNSSQTVFIPAVNSRPGMVVRKMFPRISILAIVLAHCAPGALTKVGPPTLPVTLAITRFREPKKFSRHNCFVELGPWVCSYGQVRTFIGISPRSYHPIATRGSYLRLLWPRHK